MAFLELSNGDRHGTIELAGDRLTYLVEQGDMLVGSDAPGPAVQAAVLKTPRGWALLDYTGSMTFVNRLRVADCKLIREGDRIQIGAIAVRLSEIRQQEVTEGSPLLGSTEICHYDGCGFNVGDQVIFCPACGAPHHVDCWEENKESCAAGAHCGYRKPAAGREKPDA